MTAKQTAPIATSDTDRTVSVSGLSGSTTTGALENFFQFCGKVDKIEHEDKANTATITFAKASAAKTATFLSGGTLDGAAIQVTSNATDNNNHHAAASPATGTGTADHSPEIQQEDKSRAAIAAEYLAHGYMLSDSIVQRSIDLDKKHGISERFLHLFNPISDKVTRTATNLDAQHGITQKATKLGTDADTKLGIQNKADRAAKIGQSYYESALRSSFGAKVHEFYSQGAQHIADVHEEAKRIAASRKAGAAPVSNSPPNSNSPPTLASASYQAPTAIGVSEKGGHFDVPITTSSGVTPAVGTSPSKTG